MKPDKNFDAIRDLRSACLELTSKCNLRCTYCTVSQPDYTGLTLADKWVERVLTGLRTLRTHDVSLNGHGETTTLKGWPGISAAIRKPGAHVHLTSNFARPFSEEELDELVRLKSVVVSLDTDDAELLRRTRRSVSLNVILENVQQLRDVAARRGVRGPRIIASCVVHTQNVMHLDRFVRFAVRHHIRGFVFCNLVDYPEVPGAQRVEHVTTLSREDLAEARRKLLEARGVAFSKGATCEIQSGLLDSIDRTLEGEGAAASAAVRRQRRHFAPLRQGETRRCLDPWSFALISADATVRLCCWHPPVGSLTEHPLEVILNSEPAVALRRRLMVGNLDEHCLTCPARAAVSLSGLAAVLRREIPATRFARQARRMGIFLEHALRRADWALHLLPRVAG